MDDREFGRIAASMTSAADQNRSVVKEQVIALTAILPQGVAKFATNLEDVARRTEGSGSNPWEILAARLALLALAEILLDLAKSDPEQDGEDA